MRLVREYYYNESWQMLEVWREMEIELNEEDPPPPSNEPPVICSVHEQYIWGAQYIDAPVARLRDTDSDGQPDDETLYYTYDGNFNVTGLVEPNGDVAERYAYDPYGKVTFKPADWSDAANQSKSAYDNEILYCGYRFDPESGNYIARNRYLTPPLGRWLTPDPIVYGDGMNWYQYVGSCPVRYSDPTGLWGEDTHSGRTAQWATGVGFKSDVAAEIGKADNNVDTDPSTNCLSPENASWHFDSPAHLPNRIMPFNPSDSRHLHFMWKLTESSVDCWKGNCDDSAKNLGRSLHPLQDYYAHGNWDTQRVRLHPDWYDDPTKDSRHGTDGVPVRERDDPRRRWAVGGFDIDSLGPQAGSRRITATEQHTKWALTMWIVLTWNDPCPCLCKMLTSRVLTSRCGGAATSPPALPARPKISQTGYWTGTPDDRWDPIKQEQP
jgi:RHS repeat-associated protein